MHQSTFRLLTLAILSALLFPLAIAQSPIPDSPAIEERVKILLSRMSTDDKIKLIGGIEEFYTQAVPSIGLDRLRMADGPLGVRNWGRSTSYPAGIALAATWNVDLAFIEGESLGNDARARGVHFLLGPGVNIYRSPLNSRNMEYFGEDPWLASRIAVGYIDGLQSKGVSATAKHFAGNNSEFDRHNSNSIIDERTLHEIYLPAFEAAVKEAGVGAVMDSYNLINGDHATQNHTLNTDILKKDWHFQGVLMSDWDATYDGVAAASSGLDLEMPYAKFMNQNELLPALQSGTVSEEMLDDKVRRILRIAARFGWLDRDQNDATIPLLSPASSRVALDVALEGVTLLKNEGHLLPLDINRQHTFVVVGPNSYPMVQGGGSSRVEPFFSDSILSGVSNLVGNHGKVYYVKGLPTTEQLFSETTFASGSTLVFNGDTVTGDPVTSERIKQINYWRENARFVNDPAVSDARGHTYLWHLTFVPKRSGQYLIVAAEGDRDHSSLNIDGALSLQQVSHEGIAYPVHKTLVLQEGKAVNINIRYFTRADAPHFGLGLAPIDELLTRSQARLISSVDAVIVAVGANAFYEAEGSDRTFGLPWGQDALIEKARELNPHTIVDVQAGGAVDVHSWIDRIPALIDSWYGGQSAGEALAQVLFGRSPSGKLPMSWERVAEDNPTYSHYYEEPGPGRNIHYTEGLFLGYRFYTSTHKKPLFPFGFGLSYTSFDLSHLKLTPLTGKQRLLVEFDVHNSGTVAGAEVAQVYVGDPSARITRPVKELKSFTKISLAPGATQHVVLPLEERAFSYYDTASHGWHMDGGRFDIFVGDS